MSSFFFFVRHVLAWGLGFLVIAITWSQLTHKNMPWPFVLAGFIAIAWAGISAFSHTRRVRLIADQADATTLGSRHRRHIELPMDASEAYDLVEAAIRETPRVEGLDPGKGALQLSAFVRRQQRMDFFGYSSSSMWDRDRVGVIVTPGAQGTSSARLICEPDSGAWRDWFFADHGANLENMAAITRSITRRLAERLHAQHVRQKYVATEKELAVAKLSLLHAQVEPHFLYNTLASAQYLTRSDPAKADQMLGNLITYLRNSVPRTEDSLSTLGEELERARAYLEILRIRMGERLALQIQVDEALNVVPLPPMMLQTLVENAIKHGLEPVTGGGTVWILARRSEDSVAITVADDGRGFSDAGGGTGIGLKNVRERLRLAYGEKASFSIVANFPKGVAATITVPAAGPGVAHA